MNEPGSERRITEPSRSPGIHLRKAREAHSWTIDRVAHQLRLPAIAVQSLEADDYEHFAAEVYVRGYLRNYARLVGIQPEDILKAYGDLRHKEGPHAEPSGKAIDDSKRSQTAPVSPEKRSAMNSSPRSRDPERRRSPALRWLAAALAVSLTALWWWRERGNPLPSLMDIESSLTSRAPAPNPEATAGGFGDAAPPPDSLHEPSQILQDDSAALSRESSSPLGSSQEADPATAVPATHPASEAASAPDYTSSPSDTGLDTLSLRFNEDSWATVLDANGKRLLHETGAPGTVKTLAGRAPFKVTIGRLANVSIEFNGQPFVPPGASSRSPARFSIPIKNAN